MVTRLSKHIYLVALFLTLHLYVHLDLSDTAILSEEPYFKLLQEQKPTLSLTRMGEGLMCLARGEFVKALETLKKGVNFSALIQ